MKVDIEGNEELVKSMNILQEYQKPLSLFYARLLLKHSIKGLSYKEMEIVELRQGLIDEIEEWNNSEYLSKELDELTDIMVSALILADKVSDRLEELKQLDDAVI